jgi:hypothetical protein
MATTTYGSPYVANTDLVSAWPGVSLNVAQRVDAVSYAGNGINAQTGTTYTLILTDAGKNVTLSNASSVTVTIPASSSVAYATGTVISLTNLGAGTVTVAAAGGVTLNGSTLTIGQYSRSSIMKIATDTWVLTSGGGIPKAVFSSGGTTSSYSSGGITYSVRTFTATGTLVCSTAGLCDLLLVGGGAGAGYTYTSTYRAGAGGGGQLLSLNNVYVPAGSYSIVIGAGGAAGVTPSGIDFYNVRGNNGGLTSMNGIALAIGGGGGGYGYNGNDFVNQFGIPGGNGGGGGLSNSGTKYGGPSLAGGYAGGDATVAGGSGGGGGGAGGAGATNGTAGIGASNSLQTGSAQTYAAGGASLNPASNGTANTGNGGSVGNAVGVNGNGGSGLFVVRTS